MTVGNRYSWCSVRVVPLSSSICPWASKNQVICTDKSIIPKARPSPLRAGAIAWVQTHDSSIFRRQMFDCCSRLVRQSFDNASTIVPLPFEKPSTMLRENAEAQANNYRTNTGVYSNQSRAGIGRHALHLVTGSPSEWLGCFVWSSTGFILRSGRTPFGAASLSAVQGNMECKPTSEADPKRSPA